MRALAFLVALAGPAQAQSLGLDPLSDRFATCAGRLSGLMEHQWLADDPASVETEARLGTMRELLAATLAAGKDAAALARENEAKLAWERLMKRATEEEGPEDGAEDGGEHGGEHGGWAKARAEAEIASCTQLLLP